MKDEKTPHERSRSRYPMPALWIDSTHIDTVNHVRVARVTVEQVFKRETLNATGEAVIEHMAQFVSTNKFPVRHTRPLSELATTPEKALEKLPALLTALASRAPVTAPAVMTDAGAANPQPEPANT